MSERETFRWGEDRAGSRRILLFACGAAGELRAGLRRILEEGFGPDAEVSELSDNGGLPEDWRDQAKGRDPDLVFVLIAADQCSQTVPIFQRLRDGFGSRPLIAVVERLEGPDFYALLKLGASDFLTVPLRAMEVLPRVKRLLDQNVREDALVRRLKEKLGLKQLVGESPALIAEIEKVPLIARSDANVLIAGETGTGKEMFAKAIHFLSPRSGKPFSPLNCGAVPVDLVENELFGHEAGAFTGAKSGFRGLIRETDGGSLFLDEVDCLPPVAQVKLLRFLQEKEIRPLGAEKFCRVNVRAIAASNCNLEQAVKAGRFREDLFYRLNVIALYLPPLRDRREDVPLLARHFVAKHAASLGEPQKELTAGALHKLMLYDWPGNVRELENVIERAVVLCSGAILRPEDIRLPAAANVREGESFRALKAKVINQFERSYVLEILRVNNGNITRAAQAAGKDRRAFWEVMRKHHLNVAPRTGL